MTWSLWVPGEPKAMQTGSVVRGRGRLAGRLFPIRRQSAWGNRVALAADAARPQQLLEGPLRMTIEFRRVRPRSLPHRVPCPITRPDVDNCYKGLGDALCGIVYRDDAQIVDLRLIKRFAGEPGVYLVVEPWGPFGASDGPA